VDLTPSVFSLFWEMFSIFIKNFNIETLEFLRTSFDEWGKLTVKDKNGDTHKLKLYIVDINFRNLKDPKARKEFLSMSTTLGLPHRQVDDLIEVADQLLRESPDFQEFLGDLTRDAAKAR
jgi:NTE family protein